jgi:hypothetical protein
MNNKTQRKITSEGMRQPTIHQMREKKNHRGKVKEVEKLHYRTKRKNEPPSRDQRAHLLYTTRTRQLFC